MKKIYLKPETEIFKISIRDGVLENMASQIGEKYSGTDVVTNFGGSESESGGDYDYDEVLSRKGNGGNIWDNAW